MVNTKVVFGSCNLDRKRELGARAKPMAAEIDSMNLDIAGFQESPEFEETLFKFMTPALKDDWDVCADNVNCPIIYKTTKFRRHSINGKNYIKIVMPTKPFVRSRYGSAACLQRISDGLIFIVVNLHLSNPGESSHYKSDQVLQAQTCLQDLRAWGVQDLPTVIMGDFNYGAKSGGPQQVLSNAGFNDVLRTLDQPDSIDRFFTKGWTAELFQINPVPPSVSDHDFARLIAWPGKIPGKTIEIDGRKYADPGDISIKRLIMGWKTGNFTVESAVMQTWLKRLGYYKSTVDGKIGPVSKSALEAFRRKEFKNWTEADYKSEPGQKTVERLRDKAKSSRKVVK